MGKAIYALPGQYRTCLRANAAQAGYPAESFTWQAAGEVGAMILEMPKIWFCESFCVDMVRCNEGPMLHAMAHTGSGVLFVIPHHGGFEIAARYLSKIMPLTVMYRRPRSRILSPIIEFARNATNVACLPADRSGVRGFISALRRGEAVAMLPDQVPSQGRGVWAPFFGRNAYTVILPGRLAQQTGVPVLMVTCERLPGGRGWHMRVTRIADPLPVGIDAQAKAINAAMESAIREAPEQYLWGYNRYKAPKPLSS